MGIQDITDVTTEAVTLEDVSAAAEKIKDTNPSMIRQWLESLLPGILGFALEILLAAVIYFIGTKVIKLARKILKRWLEKSDADLGARQFLDALLKYILYFILIVLILTLFGITTASVVAVVGSAGLTVGLALQGSLSNFAGGVLILLLKPFKVGDYIKEDTHGNEGTVAEISIFYTKLLTVDQRTIVIPNGTLANSSLTNVTHSDKRQLALQVGIADSDTAGLKDEEIKVFVSELGASEVTLGLRIWVKTEDYWEAKWRLTENIKLAFDEHKIEIPYQKIDIQMQK